MRSSSFIHLRRSFFDFSRKMSNFPQRIRFLKEPNYRLFFYSKERRWESSIERLRIITRAGVEGRRWSLAKKRYETLELKGNNSAKFLIISKTHYPQITFLLPQTLSPKTISVLNTRTFINNAKFVVQNFGQVFHIFLLLPPISLILSENSNTGDSFEHLDILKKKMFATTFWKEFPISQLGCVLRFEIYIFLNQFRGHRIKFLASISN